MWKRFARIAPLYWLTSTIYLIKLAVTDSLPPQWAIVSSYAFLPYLDDEGRIHPFYGLGWTLNYEMFFYLIFGLALASGAVRGPWKVLISLILLVGVGALLRFDLGMRVSWTPLYFWTDPVILFFAAGILMGKYRLWREANRTKAAMGTRWALPIVLGPSVLIILAGSLADPSDFVGARPIVAILSVLMAVLVSDVVHTRFHRLAVLLGEASFSIYLTHSFVVGPVGRIWARYFEIGSWPFAVLVLIVLCSVFGILVYRIVETPLTRWVTGFIRMPVAHWNQEVK